MRGVVKLHEEGERSLMKGVSHLMVEGCNVREKGAMLEGRGAALR